jgi:hypothetical protein
MVATGGGSGDLATGPADNIGSPGWTRTSDILINSQALYRLSYRGIRRLALADEPVLYHAAGGRPPGGLIAASIGRARARPMTGYRISRRPSRALDRVTWSAYSRSPPTGKPRAIRVIRTVYGLRSLER